MVSKNRLTFPIAILLRFGIFKKLGNLKVVRKRHEESTRVEGVPYPLGMSPTLWPPRVPSGLRFLITHKYRGSQQFSRVEYSTQIY